MRGTPFIASMMALLPMVVWSQGANDLPPVDAVPGSDLTLEERIEKARRAFDTSDQVRAARHNKPPARRLPAGPQVRGMDPESVVVEVFVPAVLSDSVVTSLCELESWLTGLDVAHEARHYIVVRPDAAQPRSARRQGGNCLEDFEAEADYQGRFAAKRGVKEIPYVALHYDGHVEHGELGQWRHLSRRLKRVTGVGQ